MQNSIVNEIHAESHAEAGAKAQIDRVDALKEKLRTAKEMVDDRFSEDDEWSKIEEQREKLLQKRKDVKVRIMKQPGVYALVDKVSELRRELKDQSEQLSLFLDVYSTQEKKTEIVDNQGRKRKIVKNNKVK